MAKILYDDLWFCTNCAIVVCNDDWSGIDEKEEKAIKKGLRAWAKKGYAVIDDDPETGEGQIEFSSSRCDCCDGLPGSRVRFAVLSK